MWDFCWSTVKFYGVSHYYMSAMWLFAQEDADLCIFILKEKEDFNVFRLGLTSETAGKSIRYFGCEVASVLESKGPLFALEATLRHSFWWTLGRREGEPLAAHCRLTYVKHFDMFQAETEALGVSGRTQHGTKSKQDLRLSLLVTAQADRVCWTWGRASVAAVTGFSIFKQNAKCCQFLHALFHVHSCRNHTPLGEIPWKFCLPLALCPCCRTRHTETHISHFERRGRLPQGRWRDCGAPGADAKAVWSPEEKR